MGRDISGLFQITDEPRAVVLFPEIVDGKNGATAEIKNLSFPLDLHLVEIDAAVRATNLDGGYLSNYATAYREAALAALPDVVRVNIGHASMLLFNQSAEQEAFSKTDDLVRYTKAIEPETRYRPLRAFVVDLAIGEPRQIR